MKIVLTENDINFIKIHYDLPEINIVLIMIYVDNPDIILD
jgi:hypothetical protein